MVNDFIVVKTLYFMRNLKFKHTKQSTNNVLKHTFYRNIYMRCQKQADNLGEGGRNDCPPRQKKKKK